MITILYIIVITATLAPGCSSQRYSVNYPSCLQSLSSEQTSYNFNIKFLKLTQFLFQSSQPQSQPQSQSSPTVAPSPSSILSREYLLNYLILLGSVCFVGFVVIVLRVKGSYYQRMRMFLGKGVGGIVGPAAVVLAGVFIVVVGLAGVGVIGAVERVKQADCEMRYIRELMLYGNNDSNWAGLYGYQNLLTLHINYLKTISTMPSAYSYSINPIISHMQTRSRSQAEFLASYQNSSISIENPQTLSTQSIAYSELFPELFDPVDYGWMDGIAEINKNFVKASQLAIQIQVIGEEIKIGGLNASNSLSKKLKQFIMLANHVDSSDIFSTNWQAFLTENSSALLIIKIFLAIGLQVPFSYLILIIISCRIKHALLIKMTNFLWVLLVVELVLCVLVLQNLAGLATTMNGYCPVYTKVLSNSTYYMIYANATARSPTEYNLYKQFYPCFFGNGSFTDFSSYQQDSIGLTKMLSNITTFLSLYNPTSPQYTHPYTYHQYYTTLSTQIQTRQHTNIHPWPYLTSLLAQLNSYTLQDVLNEKCYKHRWVSRIEECLGGEDVGVWGVGGLLVGGGVGDWGRAGVGCFVLARLEVGGWRGISYGEIAGMYMGDVGVGRCAATIQGILATALDLTNAMQVKQNSIQTLLTALETHQQSLTTHLRLLRTVHLQLTSLHTYILTLANTIPPSPSSTSSYLYSTTNPTNCTLPATNIIQLNTNICVSLRAEVMRAYFFMLVGVVVLALGIGVGGMYGVDQEMREIERLYYEGESQDGDGDGDLGGRESFSQVYRRKRMLGTLVAKVLPAKND